MSVALTTYGSDRRLELGAAEAIRRPVYSASWNALRIGLQGAWNENATNITSSPQLIIGVCSGYANVMTAATSTHVVACRITHATWTAGLAGAYPILSMSANTISGAYKRVGSTVTTANFGSAARFFSNDTATRTGIFVEITKGSPNYTVQLCQPSNSTGWADLTDTAFSNAMGVAFANIPSECPGTYTASASATIAVDEATNGTLDHIFVYWERTSHLFSFNIRHRQIS